MPLVVTVLRDEIRKFTDDTFGSFAGFPIDDVDAALKWSTAMDTYANGGPSFLLPPTTAGGAAFAGLTLGLAGISAPGAAIAVFDVAFAAYALTMAGGMGPVNVGTPPPALLSITFPTIATVFAAGVAGADANTQALAMATLIDVWMRTGTFTPTGGGPINPWS